MSNRPVVPPALGSVAVGVLAASVLAAGIVAALVAAPHANAAAGPSAPSMAPAAAIATPAVDALAAGLVAPSAAAPAPPEAAPAPAAPAAPPAPVPPLPTPVAPPVVVAPPVPSEPPTLDLQARVERALADAVPASWLEGLPATVRVIAGSTSYATGPGLIEVGDGPASGSWPHLLSVVAHEYGHLVAFRYGTRAYVGAPPAGWPDPAHGDPAEAWADCVAQAFTGVVDPSYDLPPCPQPTLDWTYRWLAGEI